MNVRTLFAIVWVIAGTTLFAHAEDSKIAGDAIKGKVVYQTYCFVCHGNKGDGNGPGGMALQPKPTDFTNKEHMATLTDEYIIKIIKVGGVAVGKSPLMIAWGPLLKEPQIQDVAAYLKTFVAAE